MPRPRSPYAEEAAADVPIMDPPLTIRPYVDAYTPPPTPEQAAQAERRWILEMALRGLDAGPTLIHGVRVGAAPETGGRTAAA